MFFERMIMDIGARIHGRRGKFTVWAPLHESVELKITHPRERIVEMQRDEMGYWHVELDDIPSTLHYLYRINHDKAWPDPVSFYQPNGVHHESAVVDHGRFEWADLLWEGIPLEQMIFYELHIGTFTPQGTFEGVIERIDYLKDLGITAIELLPVAQFPGQRNWGYDGVYPYAVQASYGGPDGLKQLVDACHRKGLAVVLDVVYNHLGPEGNYLSMFAPYFTDKYQTPWGSAVNYDDTYCYGVREYVIQNALYWLDYYHMDALRLDAVHGIYDTGARHILEELACRVKAFGQENNRTRYLIAESDLNDTRLIRHPEKGGYGLDAQWSDDFHHAVHAIVTGERGGYYKDFGSLEDVVKAVNCGFVYDWRYSEHRKRYHGNSARDLPPAHMVVCTQNHDQVGNRMMGDRISTLVSFEAQKLIAAALILSPYQPLLFMGQEYGETAPFLYFIDHNDPDLVEAVREGRKREFSSFAWDQEPPDPDSPQTYEQSKLRWGSIDDAGHAAMLAWHRQLLSVRRQNLAFQGVLREQAWARKIGEEAMAIFRCNKGACAIALLNFGKQATDVRFPYEKQGRLLLDSCERKWLGDGSCLPESAAPGQRVSVSAESLALFIAEG